MFYIKDQLLDQYGNVSREWIVPLQWRLGLSSAKEIKNNTICK